MLRVLGMISILTLPAAAAETVRTTADPESVPARFRLPATTYEVSVTKKYDLAQSGVEVYAVTFPSAVVTACTENNTVHGELFLPKSAAAKPVPGMIVLDIMDGAQVVSRGEAMWLAQNDIAALTVVMAYYGPRRPGGSKLRMLSPDIEQSVAGVTQTILDARRATAWLAARPDIDTARLGILGTSLGSFVGGVTAAVEPKITSASLLLGGGGLVDAFYDHPKAAPYRKVNEFLGGSTAGLKALIDPIDPLTYAALLKPKKLLLVAASRDDVVPPAAMTKLWEATGKPKLVWLNATHVGAAAYAFPAMNAVIAHARE